jgi:4-carboxymuconolactone decarboxylase
MGQTLHVTDGVGLVATRNGTVIKMRAGDTVYTPQGEEHWHGGTADRTLIMTTAQDTTPNKEPSGAEKLIGDFAPKLVELTDDVLFGDVWARPELGPRDRSLITCAALITNGSTEQLRAHLAIAKSNGVTEGELKEVIIHLAFYAGWPRATSAIMVAKEVFAA